MALTDEALMERALSLAAAVRTTTAPNPWVGAVIQSGDELFDGATQPPGGPHAEIVALRAAGERARGATLACTLEPCSHTGRTGPCADAVVAAGIGRVVVAIDDPDPHVAGRGLERLRAAGIEVTVGVGGDEARRQLAPYLKHRTTGRPYVVLKLAATLDGRTAAPDGTSQWITGVEARTDAHRLRAESDAVLDKLGGMGVLQLLVEGGATVAHDFHQAGLVDRYVVYLAPALMGGDDGRGVFAGPGARSMAHVWRGRIVSVTILGDDVRIDVEA